MKSKRINSKYDSDTDIMRIIAAFFVVVIHTTTISSKADIFYKTISLFSVPVFVIISGYYMLSKKQSPKKLLKKALSYFFIMLLWSACYYCYDLLIGRHSYNGFWSVCVYLLTEPVHLWYIYSLITLLLLTPLLYIFCNNASRGEYIYALAVTFILGSVVYILMELEFLSTLPIIIYRMKIPYTLGFIFLYLAGGYLQRYKPSRPLILCFLGIIGVAVSFFATLYLSVSAVEYTGLVMSFFAPNVIAAGIGFFVFVRELYSRYPIKSVRLRESVHKAAECTFGVYLLHPLVQRALENPMDNMLEGLPTKLTVPIISLVVFALSLIIVYAFRRIKRALSPRQSGAN